MSPPRVLIGFADALAAPEAAASLLSAGFEVTSFARRGSSVPLRRLRGVELAQVTAPEDDAERCADELAELGRAHDVTMPLDDTAVLLLSQLPPGPAVLAGPGGEQARLALDKREQLRAAERAGLRVPAWIELTPHERSLPADWRPPLALKPALAAERRHRGLRRLAPRLVTDERQARALLERWDGAPSLAQRWVQGVGAGVFGLADERGVHLLSSHRRVRMMNPAGSGSSACVSAPPPSALHEPIQRMLSSCGWRGMFMIELLHDGEDWWFMELNGRAWGSLALARRCGYEYPAWAVAAAIDPEAPLPAPPLPRSRQLECRHLGRELVHLLFVLRGPAAHVGGWPNRRATVRALLSNPRDSAWYNLQPGMRRLFVEDAWRTLASQTWGKRRA